MHRSDGSKSDSVDFSPDAHSLEEAAKCGAAPLLTVGVHDALLGASRRGESTVSCSLDLERSRATVAVDRAGWTWAERRYPYLEICKARTIYRWTQGAFEPLARFTDALVKLVPTPWGPPTFEIDGIKMLASEKLSPYADAERKVALIDPRGKRILDTCAGLGYFAAFCVSGHAAEVLSFEKSPDVLWLRAQNPWSPAPDPRVSVRLGDVAVEIAALPSESFDGALHDPPRFGIAGDLYSREFYEQLARVLKRRGKLFHYTGAPNRINGGRSVPEEVAARMGAAGFSVRVAFDGVFAEKRPPSRKFF